jgi:hypothetical protein
MVHDGMTDFGQGRAAALKSSSLPGDDWEARKHRFRLSTSNHARRYDIPI